VRGLYGKILRDPRHHTKLVLAEGDIPQRMFSDWAMGFKNVDDQLFATLPGYAKVGDSSFEAAEFQNSNRSALDLLKFFYDALEPFARDPRRSRMTLRETTPGSRRGVSRKRLSRD